MLPLEGTPVEVVVTGNNEFSPALSPDGHLLAYVSDKSGRYEVYVRSYPDGEVQSVSVDGGEQPVWSRDGSDPFFRSADRLLVAMVTTDPELDISTPRRMFEMPFDRSFAGGQLGESLLRCISRR